MTLLIASLSLMAALVTSQQPQAVIQTARVSGQVIEDGTNTPVVGARVFVVPDDPSRPPARPPQAAMTDRDGRYEFSSLPAGRYHIAAQKAGFAPPMEPSTMQRFEVSAGQLLDGLTVSLRRGGVIAGRVLDSLGQPQAEVGVVAFLRRLNSNDRRAGPASSSTPVLMPAGQNQTNDLGDFRIYGLSPGEYFIVASPRSDFGGAPISSSGTTTTTSTFFPGTADVSAAQPVIVQAGETVRDLTIQLVTVRAFQLSGVVVDEDGAPVPNVTVMLMGGRGTNALFSLSMGPRGMSQSDAAGRFTFADVSAGSYLLRAPGSGSGFFATSDNFVIDGGGTPRADARRATLAPAAGTIEVTIENESVTDLILVVPRPR